MQFEPATSCAYELARDSKQRGRSSSGPASQKSNGQELLTGSPDLAAMTELLDLLHRKSSRTRTRCGAIGRKCSWVRASRRFKRAGAVVAPEIPIQLDRVNTARNISSGEVEAMRGERAQDQLDGCIVLEVRGRELLESLVVDYAALRACRIGDHAGLVRR